MTAKTIDANLVLHSATVTATGQSTAITVPLDSVLYGKAVIYASAVDATTGDETYRIDLEVYDGTSYYVVGSVNGIGAAGAGKYEIVFSGETAKKLAVASALVSCRLNWTLAGTTPSLTFAAYLDKI